MTISDWLAPKPEIWNIDLVQKHAALAGDWLAVKMREALIEEVRVAIQETPIHSPIEAVFYAWWEAVDQLQAGHGDVLDGLRLSPQVSVSLAGGFRCRPDFIVHQADLETWSQAHDLGVQYQDIAIELDGHDFHERTKEQVIERNQRDRALHDAGWRVFHFSGSELVKDPERCVREVWDVAEDALWRMRREMRARRHAHKQHSPEPPQEQRKEPDGA